MKTQKKSTHPPPNFQLIIQPDLVSAPEIRKLRLRAPKRETNEPVPATHSHAEFQPDQQPTAGCHPEPLYL